MACDKWHDFLYETEKQQKNKTVKTSYPQFENYSGETGGDIEMKKLMATSWQENMWMTKRMVFQPWKG